MTLRAPVNSFGIHQATILDRGGAVVGTMRVLGDFKNENMRENVPLFGGSSEFPWNVASGNADSKINMTVKQYDLPILRYFNGTGSNSYTENTSGEASGNVSALTNRYGSSVFHATTGIASASVLGSGNPVFGDYIIEAVSSTTCNVYLNNNLDGVAYINDNLKITSSALTITSGGDTTIPGTNIKLTGGSGTIGLGTAGNLAQFSVRPQNTYNFQYRGGATGASLPEFEMYVFFEKMGTNQYRHIYYPRVRANGVSFGGAERTWAEFEAEIMVLFDSVKGYAYEYGVTNVPT